MTDAIVRLEELSFRTLPSRTEERYDGWVLRWHGHGSRRANSVNPVATSRLPLATKIGYCERWLADRGSPRVFRLTPLADPGLDEALAARGYARTSPTDVMAAPITVSEIPETVDVAPAPSQEWLRTASGNETAGPSPLDELGRQLTASGGHSRFASVCIDGSIMAIGMSIDLDATTTIYNMKTIPAARHRGYARDILRALLALGHEAGSTAATLQVTRDNAAAQALYRSAGFTPVYAYFYRESGNR